MALDESQNLWNLKKESLEFEENFYHVDYIAEGNVNIMLRRILI